MIFISKLPYTGFVKYVRTGLKSGFTLDYAPHTDEPGSYHAARYYHLGHQANLRSLVGLYNICLHPVDGFIPLSIASFTEGQGGVTYLAASENVASKLKLNASLNRSLNIEGVASSHELVQITKRRWMSSAGPRMGLIVLTITGDDTTDEIALKITEELADIAQTPLILELPKALSPKAHASLLIFLEKHSWNIFKPKAWPENLPQSSSGGELIICIPAKTDRSRG